MHAKHAIYSAWQVQAGKKSVQILKIRVYPCPINVRQPEAGDSLARTLKRCYFRHLLQMPLTTISTLVASNPSGMRT